MTNQEKKFISEIIAQEKEYIKQIIHASAEITNVKIDGINERLTKINGTIKRHEEYIDEDKLNTQIWKEEKKTRGQTCPQVDKIKLIDDNLMEYKMMKRYPKLVVGALFIYGASIIFLCLRSIGVF